MGEGEDSMIEPTSEDIGRAVVYWPEPRRRNKQTAYREKGAINSFNHMTVFVKYSIDGDTNQATNRRDLDWLIPLERDKGR